ncbi:MAG: S41 family peptidase [Verrucomicrobiaceae bacterium]|nr:S41 family peptidase [Verrucomicrobiaceae bacterium]
MKRISAILTLCACGFTSAIEVKPAVNPKARPVDEISQAAVQSAFQILRSEYIRRDDLSFDELNRAALQGLLARLDFGAELIRRNGAEPPPTAGLHSELLTPDIAYVRPQAFAEGEVTQLEMALKQFAAQKAASLILDLRSPAAPGSFDVAAGMLDCFLPKGELIFKMKQMSHDEAELTFSQTDAAWSGPVVALVDGETGNIGETIAAVLHQRQRALLVGAPTRGGTVRYEVVPVDDRWALRFAHAEMQLADGGAIFKKGLLPHFRVEMSADTKHAIFRDNPGGSIKHHVFDQPRLRYNEAALVAGKHPELDAFIRRSAGEAIDGDTMPERDLVVQRAVDMIQSSLFVQSGKLRWPVSAPARVEKGAGAAPPSPARPGSRE